MKRIGAVLVVTTVAWMAPVAASAAEGVQIEASVGLQGYVTPSKPTAVTVRVRAEVLFVGDLQVTVGALNLFTPVEIPAGSTKEYSFSIPAVGNSSRAVVQLLPENADQPAARETIGLKTPVQEILVGVLGAATAEVAIARAEAVPFGTELTVLSLEPSDLLGDMAPLSYLVVGAESLATVPPEAVVRVGGWVSDGGRLVGTPADLGRLEIGSEAAVPVTSQATIAAAGSGELILVADPSTVEDWGAVLRDVPPARISTNNFNEEIGFQMIEAASSGGESTTPSLPWLLGALAVYVTLVGPVNFLVVRRAGKPELAWITVPAISVLMVAGLWLVGRSQLDDRIVTHASIIVQDGETTRARSTLIVVAGGEGRHTVDVPSDWSIAPLDTSMMFGQQTRLEASVEASPSGGTRLGFELPNLGAAAATAGWRPGPIPLAFDLQADERGALTVQVSNDSDLSFWAWGIGEASSARAAPGPLETGQTQTLAFDTNSSFVGVGGGVIADAVFNARNFEFDGPRDPWLRVWPLAEAMTRNEATVLAGSPFFFGYTDDLVAELQVDGDEERAAGPSLVVIPLEAARRGASARLAEVIEVVGADFVDAGSGWMYAHGAEALNLRFRVGADAGGDLKLVQREGHLPGVEGIEVYNWESGVFDAYGWPATFPAAAHVSPVGEVMLRVLLPGGEFSDMDLPTGGLLLESA